MILAAWDTYSDEHTDAEGQPYDEVSYGWRMVQRDAETWRAFEPVRRTAREMLATASVQLQHIHAGDIVSRWPWQLRELSRALEKLEMLRGERAKDREAERGSPPPPEALVDSLAERNEEAWDALNTWSIQGHAILGIHAVALKTPPPYLYTAPAPVPAPTAAAGPSAGRRG
ncbi:hypothetical protein ACFVP0_10060 [Streptomyces cinereoruber]|uniref:hypothetical protein n=1 Tax=Streptomyces cinereoruber TaxID=67260 RepID=UPI0036C23EFB